MSMISWVEGDVTGGTYGQDGVQDSFAYEQPDRPHDRTADAPTAPVLVKIPGVGLF